MILHEFIAGQPVFTIPIESCDTFDGHFTDLNFAKIACSQDHHCLSVVDQGCDGDSPFQSCRKITIGGEENISRCTNSTLRGNGRFNI